MGASIMSWWTTVEKTHQRKLTKMNEKWRTLKQQYEKMVLIWKTKGVRYIPFRVRYGSKQMRVRLIPHSFYTIFSEDSDFDVQKWGKVNGELKKGGPKQIPKKCKKTHKTSQTITKHPKMSKNGIWEVGEAVRNGAQAIFPWWQWQKWCANRKNAVLGPQK